MILLILILSEPTLILVVSELFPPLAATVETEVMGPSSLLKGDISEIYEVVARKTKNIANKKVKSIFFCNIQNPLFKICNL